MRGYDAAAAVSLLGASAADAADGRFSVALDRMVGNPQAPPRKQRFGELHEQAGGGVAHADGSTFQLRNARIASRLFATLTHLRPDFRQIV